MTERSSRADDAGPAYFDGYASRYQDVVNANLAITGETAAGFTERRMAYLRRRLTPLPARVMDFGCGVGTAIPFLLRAFPGCKVVGVDVSAESIIHARDQYLDERVSFSLLSELSANDFDLVYASGVVHHISPSQRAEVFEFILERLRPGGVLAVSEHNPWNPATRYLVRTCPFDEDAKLLRPAKTRRLLETAGFEVLAIDFVNFFVGPLRRLRPIEPWLAWLPLGAQYMALARRP